MASFVFRCARCSGTPVWVRGSRSSRRCHYRVAVPPVGGGAPPALGGRRAAPVAPQLGWVRGGGGGGGAAPPARSRACVGGWGGGEWGGGLRSPGDASCRPRGGGAAWRSRPRGSAIGQGGRALPPPPSTESRILTQSLSGAPHPPAVVARRWPAGGGREGQRSVVSGLWGSRFPPALVVSALPPAGGGAPLSLGRQQALMGSPACPPATRPGGIVVLSVSHFRVTCPCHIPGFFCVCF